MNITETKNTFKREIRTENYTILEARKLHMNVSQIDVQINNLDITFGYSWDTIIMFNVNGFTFETLEFFSPTTQKHKSQVLHGLNRDSLCVDLEKKLFNYVLDTLLEGKEPTIEDIKEFVLNADMRIIKTSEKPNNTVYDYLTNNVFLNNTYMPTLKDCIKDIIYRKLWNNENNTVYINIGDIITVTMRTFPSPDNSWTTLKRYKCSAFGNKEYKNLSFLNKLHLEDVTEIL